jgi:phosphoribulokinase
MLQRIGPTLVCSAITSDSVFQHQLLAAQHIDRLNIGAIPTIRLDWLQPHEGNLVEFLFRPRAFQTALEAVAV